MARGAARRDDLVMTRTSSEPRPVLAHATAGTLCGSQENGVAVFRGIPFARPPVGELRLAAPMPVEPWDGVREAAAFGPPPPQSSVMGAPAARDTDGDWLTSTSGPQTPARPACR